MSTRSRMMSSILAMVLSSVMATSAVGWAEEASEKAGVAIGVSAGNMLFVPIKAITLLVGWSAGALSYVVTGGNAELSKQIWEDIATEPYIITPAVARKAIGERPELLEKK